MSKSCKPLYPGLFLLGAATAALVFAAPQTCAEAFRQGLALCGGPLLVSLFPFLVVSALIMRSGAGEVVMASLYNDWFCPTPSLFTLRSFKNVQFRRR